MRRLYPLALLLFLNIPCFAEHIIGGVLTYECLGGGNYRFTMKMYRDCASSGANFDFGAAFSIYKGSSATALTTYHISPQTISDIEPEFNPCLELPPNVCVEEGVYIFEHQFTDWPSSESYHISYQRCCRNNTITNIQTPGNVGATFTVEITPISQLLCNNSPVYNSFPPIAICVNEALSYDHSAFDAEGDQMVYELCAPLLGGGMGGIGGGNPNACNGVTPDPACPPPYQPVNYVNPPYSPLNPMGGNPAITIDPVTGLLSGTPTTQGQFSVGVCISEYRNGQLLSVIRRDFQFNVVQCEQLIDAEVEGDNLIPDGENYSLFTCNGPAVSLTNESISNPNILDWRWEFYVGDSTYVFSTWDVNITFPGAGVYEGALMLNPATAQCSDTAKIHIEIYPELVADFGYNYDTCVAGPVSFSNLSYINGPGNIADWKWSLGDGAFDTVQLNPVHYYDEPKVVPVKLEVWDGHGCKDDTTQAVVYKPVPALILVRPNDTISCAPAKVIFNNLSSPIDETYDLLWDFGDGETASDISPEHIYLDSGTYDVRLEITSPIGCHTDTVFSQLITIFPPPVADFYFDPPNPDNFNPDVNFFDQSTGVMYWNWFIDDKFVSIKPEFTYTFPDTGLHEVTLIVTHPEKCKDTLVQYIDVTPKVTFHMPNAFSPNEDTVNDFFKGAGYTRGITDFKLEIWDRWGNMVFQTANAEEAWNGRVNNTGRMAQAGVYVCLVSFTGPRGEPFEYQGFATLVR